MGLTGIGMGNQENREQSVCCIIVTFNIGTRIVQVVDGIISQVGKVIIVDNGSSDETPGILNGLKDCHPGKILLIRNDTNTGIAAAQNTGVKLALEQGFDWILTLDHDSIASPEMVRQLLETHDSVLHEKPGIIAPLHIDQNTGRKYRYAKYGKLFFRYATPENGPVECSLVMSSGALIRKDVFFDVGFFNEEYFVYTVDKEFCRRVIRRGYKIFASDKATLYHREGNLREHPFLFGRLQLNTRGPNSLYYIFRNTVHDFRHDESVPSRIQDILFLIRQIASILLAGSNKIERLRASSAGLRDGIRGKLGKSDRY